MRLGDVVQDTGNDSEVADTAQYRCRGCNKWVLLKEAEDAGECPDGCCDDYRCPHCRHVTRVEWPD